MVHNDWSEYFTSQPKQQFVFGTVSNSGNYYVKLVTFFDIQYRAITLNISTGFSQLLVESSIFKKVIHPSDFGGSILYQCKVSFALTKTCSIESKCGKAKWGIFFYSRCESSDSKMIFADSSFYLSGTENTDRALIQPYTNELSIKSINISDFHCDQEPFMYATVNGKVTFPLSLSNFVNSTGNQWGIVLNSRDCQVTYCNFESNNVTRIFIYAEDISTKVCFNLSNIVNNFCLDTFYELYYQPGPVSSITLKDCFISGNSPANDKATILSTVENKYEFKHKFLSTFECEAEIPLQNVKAKLFCEHVSCIVHQPIFIPRLFLYVFILLE